ncbi:MAG: putative quinol monooxygenase [Lentisphaerota bacterium]
MPQVTVIAKFTAKAGCTQKVKTQLCKLLVPTRKEKGCINYDLHEDNSDAGVFIFHENWESNELLDKHLSSEHIKNFLSALPDIIETAEVHKMTKL